MYVNEATVQKKDTLKVLNSNKEYEDSLTMSFHTIHLCKLHKGWWVYCSVYTVFEYLYTKKDKSVLVRVAGSRTGHECVAGHSGQCVCL